jgi:type I restriction enzyme S subunit
VAEWRSTTVGNVITLQRGFDITRAKQRPGTVPVVSSGGIGSHHDTPMAAGPGVVMGRKGTLGKVFYIDGDYWPHDTTLWVKDFKGNLPRFVYYFLQTLDFLSMDVGSSNPTLNRNHVHPVAISWPTLEEQNVVAGMLGALDDKIVVNECIAATAEDLCRSIFSERSWEARTTVESIAILRKEQVAPDALSETQVDHYSLPAFDSGAMPEVTDPRSIKSSKFVVRQPSVLLSKLNPEIPRVWNVSPRQEFTALASTEFLVLEPRNTVTTAELWAALSQPRLLSDLASKVTGTSKSHQRVRPVEVMTSQVVDPRDLGDARGQARTLLGRVMQARDESRTLATLRDTLLPQLMSGKLRVRDVEKIVEDAV